MIHSNMVGQVRQESSFFENAANELNIELWDQLLEKKIPNFFSVNWLRITGLIGLGQVKGYDTYFFFACEQPKYIFIKSTGRNKYSEYSARYFLWQTFPLHRGNLIVIDDFSLPLFLVELGKYLE